MKAKNSVATTIAALLVTANAATTAFVLSSCKSAPFNPTSSSSLSGWKGGFKATSSSSLSGWKGGFKDTCQDFSYEVPRPDLSRIPITKNLDNIDKITRMQKIFWPQFSWLAVPGDESTRLYNLFANDISRLGYDDEGRIWSIICPQRGFELPLLGTLMLEVTVTGVRGWVDEDTRSACADIGVVGILWIEPDINPFAQLFGFLLETFDFPFSKLKAAKVHGHAVGKPYEEFWRMSNGTDPFFFHPESMQHWDEAYSVYHLQVEMGDQILTNIPIVDDFNELLIKAFNVGSGNILMKGQKVAWNVWPNEPEVVDTEEWKKHAEKWFHSITVKHTYPTGDYKDNPTYFDGTEFNPLENTNEIEAVLGDLKRFLTKHFKTIEKEAETSDEKEDLLRVAGFLKDHLSEKKRNHVIEE
jgi:hypothetical protein